MGRSVLPQPGASTFLLISVVESMPLNMQWLPRKISGFLHHKIREQRSRWLDIYAESSGGHISSGSLPTITGSQLLETGYYPNKTTPAVISRVDLYPQSPPRAASSWISGITPTRQHQKLLTVISPAPYHKHHNLHLERIPPGYQILPQPDCTFKHQYFSTTSPERRLLLHNRNSSRKQSFSDNSDRKNCLNGIRDLKQSIKGIPDHYQQLNDNPNRNPPALHHRRP